jgi:hypothetical protein
LESIVDVHVTRLQPNNHLGTIQPEYAARWVAALPYFNTARSIKPFSELPEDDTHLTDETYKTIDHLSSCPNAEAKRRADDGDPEAALDYGLR